MNKKDVIESLNRVYFSEECHEREIIDVLPRFLKGAKLFVDIGASLGQYTYYANKYMKHGQIYAIEADTLRYEELEKNCKKWETESSNKITSVHAAACDRDGEITFYVTNSGVSGGLTTREVTQTSVNWVPESVKSLRLDTLLGDQTPEFIKIDVEGAELSVLQGATEILKKGETVFMIELHSFSGQYDPEKAVSFMKSYGYHADENLQGRRIFRKNAGKKGLLKKARELFVK